MRQGAAQEAQEGGQERQAHHQDGALRVLLQLFSPPEIPEDDADLNAEEVEQLQDAMEMDYEIGALIKEKIIPDAVSWFTGEANEGDDSEGDSDYDDEEDSEDDEDESVDEEDDDDSDEDDETPAEGKKGKAKGDDGEKPRSASSSENLRGNRAKRSARTRVRATVFPGERRRRRAVRALYFRI